MAVMPERTLDLADLGSFDEEWAPHRRTSEWWYMTGYVNDAEGGLYSFQFTLLRLHGAGMHAYVLMAAMTDFSTGEHHYVQRMTPFTRSVTIQSDCVAFGDIARVTRSGGDLLVEINCGDWHLDVCCTPAKDRVWHCDEGLLKMGHDDPRAWTFYYSWTNLATSGTLAIDGERREVTGKSWFDKQGGPFDPLDPRTHWEWFSLRFFDGEEVMLFDFPHQGYRDGTYVRADGSSSRLNRYALTRTGSTTAGGLDFSNGWILDMSGIKGGRYTITPLMEGQINLAYFELLASITDSGGERVGYCFVELLPGVLNGKRGTSPLNFLRRR